MDSQSERKKLLSRIGYLDEDTYDPCHRCRGRTDIECFILAGKLLRRHHFSAQLRWYIMFFSFWLYWPWPVLSLVRYLIRILDAKASHEVVLLGMKKGLAYVRREFQHKRVLDHGKLGSIDSKASSSKSVTKNPKARRDGLDVCQELLVYSSSLYAAAGELALDFAGQYRRWRSISVAQLTELLHRQQVPGFRSAEGYSTLRFARSMVLEELPFCRHPFRDSKADWRRWRRMGCDTSYLRRLGIWDYEDAVILRDRVGFTEQRCWRAPGVYRQGKYSLADLRCFVCLSPKACAVKPERKKRNRSVDDLVGRVARQRLRSVPFVKGTCPSWSSSHLLTDNDSVDIVVDPSKQMASVADQQVNSPAVVVSIKCEESLRSRGGRTIVKPTRFVAVSATEDNRLRRECLRQEAEGSGGHGSGSNLYPLVADKMDHTSDKSLTPSMAQRGY